MTEHVKKQILANTTPDETRVICYIEPRRVIAIDHHALGQGPQIGALAGGDDDAEMRMETVLPRGRGGGSRAAIVSRVLHLAFVVARNSGEQPPRRAISF